MAQFQKIFHNRKIRSVYDIAGKTYWYSVVDVIAALRNTDYDTARKYWKNMKSRFARGKNTFKFNQMKLTAKDGKQRFTDVMRHSDIVKLVQKLPRSAGAAFRKLIGAAAAGTAIIREFFGKITADKTEKPGEKIFQTITRRAILRTN